jgi:hypothetical protein
LPVGFACGFCLWVLPVGFACEFSSVRLFICEISSVSFHLWVFICEFSSVSFHLWVFICEFSSVGFLFKRSMQTKYADGVCERSMRAKYANEAFFWWDDHYTNILLQCEASLHHCITSSHVFFKIHVFLIFISLSSFFKKKIKFSKRTNFS